jgi:hypothetical protein
VWLDLTTLVNDARNNPAYQAQLIKRNFLSLSML